MLGSNILDAPAALVVADDAAVERAYLILAVAADPKATTKRLNEILAATKKLEGRMGGAKKADAIDGLHVAAEADLAAARDLLDQAATDAAATRQAADDHGQKINQGLQEREDACANEEVINHDTMAALTRREKTVQRGEADNQAFKEILDGREASVAERERRVQAKLDAITKAAKKD